MARAVRELRNRQETAQHRDRMAREVPSEARRVALEPRDRRFAAIARMRSPRAAPPPNRRRPRRGRRRARASRRRRPRSPRTRTGRRDRPARKRTRERSLEGRAQRLLDVAVRARCRERHVRRAAAPGVTAPGRVERVAGQARVLEHRRDRALEALALDRAPESRGVHRVVRVARAPREHRRLEQVEGAGHGVTRPRACVRAASRHQASFTACHNSAASSRLDASSSAGSARASPGRQPSIHARAAGSRARCSVRGSPIWLVRRREVDVAHLRAAERPVGVGSPAAKEPAIGSKGMVMPTKTSALSGTSRSFAASAKCPRRMRGSRPVAITTASGTSRSTTRRSVPVPGSRKRERSSGACVAGSTSGQLLVAGEDVQRVDHHAAALAVADDHRPHAVALGLPREDAGERAAVEIAVRGHGAGLRIDELPRADSPCPRGTRRAAPS